MRTWLQIFQILAEVQPGDMDKLSPEEADLVRQVVARIEVGETLCLGSEQHQALSDAVDKLAPSAH